MKDHIDMTKNLFIFKSNDKEVGRFLSSQYFNYETITPPVMNIFYKNNVYNGIENAYSGTFEIIFDNSSINIYKKLNNCHNFSLIFYHNIFEHSSNIHDIKLAISTKNLLNSNTGEILNFSNCYITKYENYTEYNKILYKTTSCFDKIKYL
jgi:hypothetical protein